MMYAFFRGCLFFFEPEVAHKMALTILKCIVKSPLKWLLFPQPIQNPRKIQSLQFKNPVGLAAGFDKNADYLSVWSTLGFGFVEVGTVTPRPQSGNPKPRLFRLPTQKAIINRLGFNNLGVDHLVSNVVKSNYQGILGINIGKNADTPLEKAHEDYLICLEKVYPYADYVTVNISSPNTENLRSLQFGENLSVLLSKLKAAQADLEVQYKKYVPLFIKVAPDLDKVEVTDIAHRLLGHKMDGLIATNTTIDRSAVQSAKYSHEKGGLSGAPLASKSTEILTQFSKVLKGQIPIIGVGGIDSVDAAETKFKAGASLVQVYTGLIYEGPGLIQKIAQLKK